MILKPCLKLSKAELDVYILNANMLLSWCNNSFQLQLYSPLIMCSSVFLHFKLSVKTYWIDGSSIESKRFLCFGLTFLCCFVLF